MIQIGDILPNCVLEEGHINKDNKRCADPLPYNIHDIVSGKKIVLFAVPGAFTPDCSNTHLPGYIKDFEAIKSKGVDEIWCVSVNDPYVMVAWGDAMKADKIRMLADGSGIFTKSIGLEFDLIKYGMGIRSQRYAMILNDGVVSYLAVEDGDDVNVSSSESILEKL